MQYIDYYLSNYYKNVSKVFMFLITVVAIILAVASILGEVYSQYQSLTTQFLILATLASTFLIGLYNQIDPVSKWYALKTAELQFESEIWKFRTRVGIYNTEKHPNVSKSKLFNENLKAIMNNTLSKAGITEVSFNQV
mmetsp:Transcript_38989/g.32909  ORF Transcript_38989/g.32909 Transcript_38989/m.32909 type:complete len:138 (-) Transcript_38989:664-1077(-)